MEALLSFVPEAPMWQRQVGCEPDLNVICATEEQVYEWIATDTAEAHVLSQMMVEGEAWALVMTSSSEPMWLPESSLERTESSGLAIVIAATEGFGNRAVVEWVPVAPDLEAEWLQVEVAADYVLFRRWDDAVQRTYGPVMRASAFDVIRRAPLERPVRSAQDRSAGHESPSTRPSTRTVTVALPDNEAAPGLLERFLKSAISSGASAPAARLVSDKLAAMSVELPATLPALPVVSDPSFDQSTTQMVAAAPPEAANPWDAPAPSDVEQAIGTPRPANQPSTEAGVRPSPQLEPTTAPGQAAAGTRVHEAFGVDIESDLAGEALAPGIVARKAAAMVSPSPRPVPIRDAMSETERGAEDWLDSVSRKAPQQTRPTAPASDAALPPVPAGARAREALGASVKSDPARLAVPSPVPGHAGAITSASRNTAKPATIVQSLSRSSAFGEPRPNADPRSGLPASASAGASAPGTQLARPPVLGPTVAASALFADEHAGRVSADAAAGFPVGRAAPGVPSSEQPARGPVPEEPQAYPGLGAQGVQGLAQEPAASRVSNVRLPSSPEVGATVTRPAASPSWRQQPTPELEPPAPATPRQRIAMPSRPGEDLTLPASRDVSVQRLPARVPAATLASTRARGAADDRQTAHPPFVAGLTARKAEATEPLVSVRVTATVAPVIHIAPAAERREHGRDALMAPKMRVIRNVSIGRVVVEVGEPENASRQSSRKVEPGSLLASIPPPALRGFS
jgi:hypothetical protein